MIPLILCVTGIFGSHQINFMVHVIVAPGCKSETEYFRWGSIPFKFKFIVKLFLFYILFHVGCVFVRLEMKKNICILYNKDICIEFECLSNKIRLGFLNANQTGSRFYGIITFHCEYQRLSSRTVEFTVRQIERA